MAHSAGARGDWGDAISGRSMSGGETTPRRSATVRLKNDGDAIRALEREVAAVVAEAGYPEAAQFAIRLALEEAVYNAFRHGHKDLPDEPIEVTWKIDPRTVSIEVEDRGPGFDPRAVPDPTREDRLELPHGRGLMLMRAYMTHVEYEGRGNRVSMRYDRPDDE